MTEPCRGPRPVLAIPYGLFLSVIFSNSQRLEYQRKGTKDGCFPLHQRGRFDILKVVSPDSLSGFQRSLSKARYRWRFGLWQVI